MSTSRIEASDTIVLFADLQTGIADLPLTISTERLKKGVLNLAKLAKLFAIPAIVTAVQSGDGEPEILSEIEQGLGKLPIHIRTTADAFRNDAIASAIKSSGRRTVLISGVATELAVALPAISGAELGYRTFIVVDASGGTSERTEQSALQRVIAHDGSTTCVMTLAGELADDFRTQKAEEAMSILFSMARV